MTYVNADSLNSTLSRFTIPDTSETWHLNATNFNAGSNIIAYWYTSYSSLSNISRMIHSCPKLSLQPVLSFSSFVHNSSINEKKEHEIERKLLLWND